MTASWRHVAGRRMDRAARAQRPDLAMHRATGSPGGAVYDPGPALRATDPQKAGALRYLTRRGALDVAEMLGLVAEVGR